MSEEERGEVEDRVRRLLVGAPSDRAWRRRGWVVLCRNRVLLRSTQQQQQKSATSCHTQGGGGAKDDPMLNGGSSGSKSVGGNGGGHHAAKVPRTASTATAGAGAAAGAGGNNAAITTAAPSLFGHGPRGNSDAARSVDGRIDHDNGGIPSACVCGPTRADGLESGGSSISSCACNDNGDDEGGDEDGRSDARRDLPGAIYRLMGLTEGVFREIVGFL